MSPGSARIREKLINFKPASQVYRASGLNLLIAAIVMWNTRYLEQTFVELERQGVDVSPTIVAHVAPLGWGACRSHRALANIDSPVIV
ncbi:MAG: Tn3 family transposase [Verrucomicrobia bacterium]|nr:Tn3 family transposase [Verrucomicrobiota bacterium]